MARGCLLTIVYSCKVGDYIAYRGRERLASGVSVGAKFLIKSGTKNACKSSG